MPVVVATLDLTGHLSARFNLERPYISGLLAFKA